MATESARAGLDPDLVLRAQSGEREARDELARRHGRSAYLLALQLLGNPADAQDVAQESLLRFFAGLRRLDPRRPVQPWLFTIVRNRARDVWRRRKVRRAESLDAPGSVGEGLGRQVADERADPEADLHRAELKRRVWRALGELSPARREILVLRDYHDLSYAEIAAVLGIPKGTVMSRLHGARKALRERLLPGAARETEGGAR